MCSDKIILYCFGCFAALNGLIFLVKKIGLGDSEINIPKFGTLKTGQTGVILFIIGAGFIYWASQHNCHEITNSITSSPKKEIKDSIFPYEYTYISNDRITINGFSSEIILSPPPDRKPPFQIIFNLLLNPDCELSGRGVADPKFSFACEIEINNKIISNSLSEQREVNIPARFSYSYPLMEIPEDNRVKIRIHLQRASVKTHFGGGEGLCNTKILLDSKVIIQ